MIKDSFYLTLLSNSSMLYYPNNTTANFSTKLPKTIKLEGQWSVGLVEFQYPCSMLNVQEYENTIYVTKKVQLPMDTSEYHVEYKTKIPSTNYDDVENILIALNNNSLLKDKVNFRYDKITKKIFVTVEDSEIVSLKLSPTLSIQLGFAPYTNFVSNSIGKRPVNLYLGLPSQLFVYNDIIEPQVVGDVMTSLLRVISLDPSKYIYGANKISVFSPAHYVPVMRREFDTIEIDIRSNLGEKIPFQFGTTCVKLHFKQTS